MTVGEIAVGETRTESCQMTRMFVTCSTSKFYSSYKLFSPSVGCCLIALSCWIIFFNVQRITRVLVSVKWKEGRFHPSRLSWKCKWFANSRHVFRIGDLVRACFIFLNNWEHKKYFCDVSTANLYFYDRVIQI